MGDEIDGALKGKDVAAAANFFREVRCSMFDIVTSPTLTPQAIKSIGLVPLEAQDTQTFQNSMADLIGSMYFSRFFSRVSAVLASFDVFLMFFSTFVTYVQLVLSCFFSYLSLHH